MRVSEWTGSPQRWDDFVRQNERGTPYHLHGWLKAVVGAFGHDVKYLVAQDSSDAICGVLPLAHVKSVPFGNFLVSVPFSSYGGPLGDDEAIVLLAAEAERISTERRVQLLEFRSATELPLQWPASRRKVAVVLPLPSSEDALFKSFGSKLRSQVRKPEKEGVTVEHGLHRLADFVAVYSRHMRDLGTPALPRRFFEQLAAHLPAEMTVMVAYHDGAPVAGAVGFDLHGQFEVCWASSLRSHSRIAPNMKLYWEMMKHAMARGNTRFNFGRSTADSGTHRFKLQWGGHDEPLHWYQGGSSAVNTTPSSDSRVFSLASIVWRRLPLSVATFVGGRIVRYIP